MSAYTDSLIAAAKCFDCIPPGTEFGVMIELMRRIVENEENPPEPPEPPPPPIEFPDIVTGDGYGWVDRVAANGGTAPPAGMVTALSTFVAGLTSANILTKMKSICCLVPGAASPAVAAGDLIRALTPLIVGKGFDPWTNNGPFVPGDLTVNGLKSNGSSKWLNTGSNAYENFAWKDRSGGQTIMASEVVNETKNDFGVLQGGTCQLISNYSGSSYFQCWDGGGGSITGAPPTGLIGYFSGNRIDSLERLYAANTADGHSQKATSTNTAGTMTQLQPFYLFALNNVGPAFGVCNKRISFAALHDGLTLAESATFYGLIQALRTSLGGGTV